MKYYEEFGPDAGGKRLGFIKAGKSDFAFDIAGNVAYLNLEETMRLVFSLGEHLKNISDKPTKRQSGNVIYLYDT